MGLGFVPMGTAWLARARQDVAALLPGTCIIQSVVYGSDGAGGVTATYTASGTVACRVDPQMKRDRLSLRVLAERMDVDYTLTVPYGTAIDAHYRVIYQGRTYEIGQVATEHAYALDVRTLINQVR
jgi:SPP1 family predicted phage head-tail adaptor